MTCPVRLPVQLGEVLIPLKLANDAVTVEHETHLAADVFPVGELGVVQRQAFAQLAAPGLGQEIDQLERSTQDPDGHHVGVGVVIQTRGHGSEIALVVLVRAHHTQDLVSVECRIVPGDARPKAADLEDHLRPVVDHEVDVARRLVVLPDVVGDR